MIILSKQNIVNNKYYKIIQLINPKHQKKKKIS